MTETDIKIRIRNLYKVFGENPRKAMKHVHAGLSKAELLDQHSHVLGLKDISLDIKARELQAIDLSESAQQAATSNPLVEAG